MTKKHPGKVKGMKVVDVVAWGRMTPDGTFGVEIDCPWGCREGLSGHYSKKPKRHYHGWSTSNTEWGGSRGAHCGYQLGPQPSYQLHWTDMPEDVRRALREREERAS